MKINVILRIAQAPVGQLTLFLLYRTDELLQRLQHLNSKAQLCCIASFDDRVVFFCGCAVNQAGSAELIARRRREK